jgi:hypothetical protein
MNVLLTFVIKQATLMRRSTVLSLPLQLVFPVAAKAFLLNLGKFNKEFYRRKQSYFKLPEGTAQLTRTAKLSKAYQ